MNPLATRNNKLSILKICREDALLVIHSKVQGLYKLSKTEQSPHNQWALYLKQPELCTLALISVSLSEDKTGSQFQL